MADRRRLAHPGSGPDQLAQIFADLQAQTAEAAQGVVSEQGLLETQTTQIQKSQEQLQRRMAELEGNPNAPEGADPDVADGLVSTLRTAETSRDTELKSLDELRHRFDAKYQDLQALIAEIRQLHGQLPAGATAEQSDLSDPVAGGRRPADTVR